MFNCKPIYIYLYLSYIQWDFQDPKMEVLYHIRQYFAGIFPYIGLIYGRYLQFGFLLHGQWFHGHVRKDRVLPRLGTKMYQGTCWQMCPSWTMALLRPGPWQRRHWNHWIYGRVTWKTMALDGTGESHIQEWQTTHVYVYAHIYICIYMCQGNHDDDSDNDDNEDGM